MKKTLLAMVFSLVAVAVALAQTVVLDFETPATTTTFQYFGSGLDGQLTMTVVNPNPTGINTSATVLEFVKPGDAQTWAGAFSNPNPATPIDLVNNGQICVKVHMDHPGNLALKLEGSTTGGDNWLQQVNNTVTGEWVELCFDANLPSLEAPFTAAAGHVYERVVLFFDFGTAGTGSNVTSYVDDIVVKPSISTTVVLDFESEETTTDFQYFGSSLDGTFTSVQENPLSAGINTSDSVVCFIKPADAQVWAGAFSNPNPDTAFDLVNNGQICIKVLMDHIGNLALKLEGSTTGGDNWIQQVENTKVGEWEELCFDASLPSLEAPFTAAAGHVYERVVLFFDFGTSGAADTSYFDDLVIKGGGGPQIRTITFWVDMNDYSGAFAGVYVSGTFNNWSGDANPLSDPDNDGIWEGQIPIPTGAHEFKFTVDNWADQEDFTGLETCVTTDTSGQFHNRRLLVTEDEMLDTVCFNSCYACGEEIEITFRLGMGDFVPHPDGVWLAGGGNFDVPGGPYRMEDFDGDGVWEITVPRQRGFSSYYTFTNGPCPDYSCKENIEGQSCAQPQNFNDRWLPPVTQDTIVATCFQLCTTTTDCTVGTGEAADGAASFRLLGNPGRELTLVFDQPAAATRHITVFNPLGQAVQSVRLNAFETAYRLDTHGFAPGIYFVNVQTAGRQGSLRVVIP